MSAEELLEKVKTLRELQADSYYKEYRLKVMKRVMDEKKQRNAVINQGCKEMQDRINMIKAIAQTSNVDESDPHAESYFSYLSSQVNSCSEKTQAYFENMKESVSKLAETKKKFDKVQETAEWLAQLKVEEDEVETIGSKLQDYRQRLEGLTAQHENSIQRLQDYKKYELNTWIVQCCKEAVMTAKFKKKLAKLLVVNSGLSKEHDGSMEASFADNTEALEESPMEQDPVVKPAEKISKQAKKVPKTPVEKPQVVKPAEKVSKQAKKPIAKVVQKTPSRPSKKVSFAEIDEETTFRSVAIEQEGSSGGSNSNNTFGLFNNPSNENMFPAQSTPALNASIKALPPQITPIQVFPAESDVEMKIDDDQASENGSFTQNFNFGESGVAELANNSLDFGDGIEGFEASPFAMNTTKELEKESPGIKMSFLHDDEDMDFNQGELNESANIFPGFMGMGGEEQSQGGMNDLFSTQKAEPGIANADGDGEAGASMFDFFGGSDSPIADAQDGDGENFSFHFGGETEGGSRNHSDNNMLFK